MHLRAHACVRVLMCVCVRLRFTVNRRFGSQAVLTGSPGTIALSDPLTECT